MGSIFQIESKDIYCELHHISEDPRLTHKKKGKQVDGIGIVNMKHHVLLL